MSKHTPGPWEWTYRGLYAGNIPVLVPDNEHGSDLTIKSRDADDMLIAAAPDLLAACEQALAAIDADNAHMEIGRRYAVDEARDVLIAAIAKAKGETP